MLKITLPADRAVVDMGAVARAFGISTNDLEADIDIGTISQWFEVGEGDEDDKPHQIFASATLGIRVDVDESGAVCSVSEYDGTRAVLPPDRAKHSGAGISKDSAESTLGSDMQADPDTVRKARLDALLDKALDQSFPASDPIAVSFDPPPGAAHPPNKPEDG